MNGHSTVQIDQISPVAAALPGGNTITITGSGFQKDAVIFFGTQLSEKTSFESETTLKVVVPATTEPGSVAVTVVNPDGTQFTRLGGFTYVAPDSTDRAVVLGVSPLTIIEREETEITLTGRNLLEAYDQGLVALRTASSVNLNISKVEGGKTEEEGIEFLTFKLVASPSAPLAPKERIVVQVLASRRPGAREDLIVESSKQMFVVLPRDVPVPLAYTPGLSHDQPTMFVVLGRNLEGCTLQFGDGVQSHLQTSDEGAIYSLVTISDKEQATSGDPQFSILDNQGNSTGEYNLTVAQASAFRQSDPIPEDFLGEGARQNGEDDPVPAFTMDLTKIPEQVFMGPTAEDAALYDLSGNLPTDLTFNTFTIEFTIFTYSIHLPIFRRVIIFPSFDGAGAEIGSAIVVAIGELTPIRAVGILFAARIDITIHITVMVIITIDFPFFTGFNEFPDEFPNAIGIIIRGIVINIEIDIIISFLSALIRPDGSLRLLYVFDLIIGIDFNISFDGRHLNFVPNFTHKINYSSIYPQAQSLLCDGRFELASDQGQTLFSDGYGGSQAFYFARSAGQCCLPWDFNLELVRFRSGQPEQVIQVPFSTSMCLEAPARSNFMSVLITSENPEPTGLPPTLRLNLGDTSTLLALAQPVDETGTPNGSIQDLRALGYDIDFFLQFPLMLLDPTTLPDGNAFAIQVGQNLIRAAIPGRTSGGLPYAFWAGAIFGFDIIRYLAVGEEPRVVMDAFLPLDVNANPDAIKVEPVLAYEEDDANGQRVLVAAPLIPAAQNQIQPATDLWELERYEPFEDQREFFLAVKVEIPQNVPLPVTLNFKVKLPQLRKYVDEETAVTNGVPYSSFTFGTDRHSTKANDFFTGNMVDGTQSTPVPASLTYDTIPSPTALRKVGNIKIIPNVKEEDQVGTRKKIVAPGKNVILKNGKGTNFLVTIPIECVPDSGSSAQVTLPKPELYLAVRNDETFEEFLRVFKQVQPLITGAGTYFEAFASELYKGLGSTPDNTLATEGGALWSHACSLVTPASGTRYLDDRPLYWTRMRALGAARAYGKRHPNTVSEASLKKFDLASRGLDPADGGIKFVPLFIPPGARKVTITGFDPFSLDGGASGTTPPRDLLEQSNPSGLIALALNGQTITVPNLGIVYVRTAIFPVRYFDFNKNIVENAIPPLTLGSIVMLISLSENSGLNYYDVERWACSRRADSTDNNNKKGRSEPSMPAEIPAGNEFLESTLPFFAVIRTAESLEAPLGTAPFVIDQSYKTLGRSEIREQRRLAATPPTDDPPTSIVAGKFRPEPLKTDSHGHSRATDIPLNSEGSLEGSGSSFLSNEIFYRIALKRENLRPRLASGHIHVPSTAYTPNSGGGTLLLTGINKALVRFFNHGFHLSGPEFLGFPPTVINTTSAEISMVVTNDSNQTINIGAIEVTPPFSVVLATPSPLPMPVAAGATVSFPFKFAPTAVTAYTGTITFKESSGEILLVVEARGSGIQNQPAPTITSFDPHEIFWGDFLTVTGQYFTTASLVKIGNREVNFSITSDTEILIETENLAAILSEEYSITDDAMVPPNGTGSITGFIKVTTAFGTAISATTVRIFFNYPE